MQGLAEGNYPGQLWKVDPVHLHRVELVGEFVSFKIHYHLVGFEWDVFTGPRCPWKPGVLSITRQYCDRLLKFSAHSLNVLGIRYKVFKYVF